MTPGPLRVGLVGCGKISETYVRTLAGHDALRVVRCADLDPDRAQMIATAAEAEPATTTELLSDDHVDVVLNLTPPDTHADIAIAALRTGKHVYGEKPLAVDRDQARTVLDEAAARGLAVGCAPDTFLGASWQEARALVDAGAIGEPVSVRATMLTPGPESWHPDPAFFYRRGGGPLLDMGPYHVSAIVTLLGPVARVSASARTTHDIRPVTGGPRAGELLAVEVPTHVAALLELESGAIATLVTSFDCWDDVHSVEVWGTEGTLLLPDPNGHNGTIRRRGRDPRGPWETLNGAPEIYARGIGVLEMAEALQRGGLPRASGELAFHVLDTLLAILESAESGAVVDVESRFRRPEPLAAG
ncbi:MAG TPA: Gfo/Idh/MocA family oxidoreductase [Gaiellaceae bacterium]|nr:Gfo/Idh/MocA family oxidoreductase [Gaiellaceae bacterium]